MKIDELTFKPYKEIDGVRYDMEIVQDMSSLGEF